MANFNECPFTNQGCPHVPTYPTPHDVIGRLDGMPPHQIGIKVGDGATGVINTHTMTPGCEVGGGGVDTDWLTAALLAEKSVDAHVDRCHVVRGIGPTAVRPCIKTRPF